MELIESAISLFTEEEKFNDAWAHHIWKLITCSFSDREKDEKARK